MTPSFAVHPSSHYQRLSTKLQKGHRDFEATERSAAAILSADPYNRVTEPKHQETGRGTLAKTAVGEDDCLANDVDRESTY